MTDTREAATQTPMSDHIARFWHLLETEDVYISLHISRARDGTQPPHWDTSHFPADVAKALVQDRVGKDTEREISVVWLDDRDPSILTVALQGYYANGWRLVAATDVKSG